MTFNLVGIGLNKESLSVDALKVLKTCDKIYLENYTVNFPYPLNELEKELGLKFIELKRASIEDESIIEESKDQNIALLVYGDSLSATTHIQLILECKKQKIEYRIFHNASIITAIAETGLQPYKFGKTASMPNWEEHTNKPTSFMNYIKENQSIKAHTLILTDIGLTIENAIDQLGEASKKEDVKIPGKIIVCSNIGTKNQEIFYDSLNNLKEIEMPFCLIIPSEMHFLEEEALEKLKDKLK
ncbi:diphthine synthase [Candidatus Pacearchaeota archaeon]|nr:diphthine synthase [Candidatus Pacearchaeota archaeon]